MNCINNFTIVQGIDNEFILTIKQTGTTMPMEMTNEDVFSAKLQSLDGIDIVNLSVVVTDLQNGKITISVPQSIADELTSEKGDSVDLYYPKPTYKLMIDCDTQNNGKFIARIPYVYVE